MWSCHGTLPLPLRYPISLSPPFARHSRHFSPNANLPHERADQFPSLPMPPIKTLLFERPRDLGFRNSPLWPKNKKKKERKFARKERMFFFFFSFLFFLTDRYTQVIRRVWQESSFRWKLLGETSRVISDTGGCGSTLERSVRFLEKDEKGNVNSSTRVPLHPVRAKSVSLFIRGKREISLDCKFHIHVGFLINTLPASASSEQEWGFFYYYYQSFLSFDSRFTTT